MKAPLKVQIPFFLVSGMYHSTNEGDNFNVEVNMHGGQLFLEKGYNLCYVEMITLFRSAYGDHIHALMRWNMCEVKSLARHAM